MNVFASGFFGSSNLYFQLEAWMLRLPFDAATSARLLSVAFGAAAIVLTFLFGRRAQDVATGICAAAAVAFLHVHIHFSRIGIPNINDTLIAAAVLFATVWALHRRTLTAFGIAGLVCGLSPYAWTTARIVPLAALIMFVVAFARADDRTGLARGAGAFMGGFLIVASPLLLWWAENPHEARTRETLVLIFAESPGRASWLSGQQQNGESLFEIFVGQSESTLDALVTGPEVTPHLNSKIGVFGPLPGMLLVIGAAVAVRNLGRPANSAVLGLLLASIVGGAIITVPPVSAARLTGCIVPGAYLMALGARALANRSPYSGPVREQLALGIVVLSCLPGLFYYFGEWRQDQRYSDGNTRIVERWGELVVEHARPGSTIAWFASPPVDANHPTLRFLLAGREVYVIGEDGRARSVGGHLGQPSPTLTIVATGSEAPSWQSEFASCRSVDASFRDPGAEDFLALTLFEPDGACADEVRSAFSR